ncbi:hypothetical protein J4465_03045 [Candidatus Pacearchaeota archaeon]|nr:hypothetical protein [Candidatus Pacearchaeota archaeon]
MKTEIKTKTKKPLVERTELEVKFSDFEKTPSYIQIKEEVSKLIGAKQELILPQRVNQEFGMREATVLIYVYDSEEGMKKFSIKKKEKTGSAA